VPEPVNEGGSCGQIGLCSEEVCRSGQCVDEPVNEGQTCGGGFGDCLEGRCAGGDCLPFPTNEGLECDSGSECTVEVCRSGFCNEENVPPGTPCGNPADTQCTDPDTCNATGFCLHNDEGSGTPCDLDNDACTIDICDQGGQCIFVEELECDQQITCPVDTVVLTCNEPGGSRPDPDALGVSGSNTCGPTVFSFDRDIIRPTCNDAPVVVTATAEDPCGEQVTCEVTVRVSGPMCCPGIIDTDLTLLPVDMDLRQDTNGPVTTKAKFDIFNQNEVRFSGTQRCITCWDQTLLSRYDSPNHFLIENLHTDRGRARIDGLQSALCPDLSQDSPLLGVSIRDITFAGWPPFVMRSAKSLVGMGLESAVIRYDVIDGPDEAKGAAAAIEGSRGFRINTAEAIEDAGVAGIPVENRGSISKKGSVVIFPKVELKWRLRGDISDDAINLNRGGFPGGDYILVQDTFIEITNDYPADVRVLMYFVNGDLPTDAYYAGDPRELVEREHPGWNNVDVEIDLTGDETAYWSVRTGLPKGVTPFDALDSGFPPGRPDPEHRSQRLLRGYVVVWAVDANGNEISWNHLSGGATMVHYGQQSALEYAAWAAQCVTGAQPGEPCGPVPGELNLNGLEYDACPAKLLFDFYTSGSQLISHPAICDDGEPCDDGRPCTIDDICDGGVCRGTPVACQRGNVCSGDGACVPCPPDALCRDTVCGGPLGAECIEPNTFCHVPDGECSADAGGECRPTGFPCPAVYDPVCGCNGVTYGNACEAGSAGANVLHSGTCQD
jgi:hypothetical protein